MKTYPGKHPGFGRRFRLLTAATLLGIIGFGPAAFGESNLSGGYYNTATSKGSSVSGGYQNEASGDFSSVSGGRAREAAYLYNWAAGSLSEGY